MDALVVFESMFGNGSDLAVAIAEGIRPLATVHAVDVAAAPAWPDVDLLVVEGPNHHLGPTMPASRAGAARNGAPQGPRDADLTEWAKRLRRGSAELVAAVYDIRLERPRWRRDADHGSTTIAHHLRRHGIQLLAPPAHFLVVDAQGPLCPGERERARTWGQWLAREASHVRPR